MTPERPPRPKYAIINETDTPEPAMVVQWVHNVGYCYMDRRGTKPNHDGMRGEEATSLEDFGIVWAEDRDGIVHFYLSDRQPVAKYRDGEPRRWQSCITSFGFRKLTRATVVLPVKSAS